MNPEELRLHAAQGRLRHEDGIGFFVDGVLVTDEADHRECARVLGMPVPPFRAAALTEPAAHLRETPPPDTAAPVAPEAVAVEPEREPTSGVVLPSADAEVADPDAEAPAPDAARETSTPEPEED